MPRLKEFETTSVIVRNDEGYFLGVSRKDNYNLWGFAGGKCESGESPEDCAKRELLEETGLVAEEMKLVDIRLFQNRYKLPYSIDNVHCYEVTKYSGELHTEEKLKELGEGMLCWVGTAELISGAFGQYNTDILTKYYGLEHIYIIEQHFDYEGSSVEGVFSTQESALAFIKKMAEDYNERLGRVYYRERANGSYSFSGGSLDVESYPVDLTHSPNIKILP